MFYIVETKEQLEEFYNKGFKDVFIEIIPYNNNIHPILNDVSLIYIRPLSDTKGYMLCINHNETLSLQINDVEQLLESFEKIYVQDKKSFLYYFQLKNCLDCSIIINNIIKPKSTIYDYFYNEYPHKNNVNLIIPLVKHYEICEIIFNDLNQLFSQELPSHFEFYNNKAILAFLKIESNGIKINKKKLYEKFEPTQEFYSIKDDKIFTHYNLYTTTHRPSNSFNNINFAALNKENGCRKSFIPENDKFVEFDISGCHLMIVSKLIGYDFGDEDIHQSFAKMYGVSYDEAKKISFRNLNGNIYKEYKDLEYFKKLQKYKDELWEKFNKDGFVESPISKYRFYKSNLDEMNPNKLLNYLIQNIETEGNILILLDIHKILRGKQSKIIHYIYDAMLIDYNIDEEGILEEISQVFNKHKFKIKTKIFEANYDNYTK